MLICDDTRDLHFYLGTHRASWLTTAPIDVSLFISHRVLRKYKRLPAPPRWPFWRSGIPLRHVAIDSGAFTELSLYHQFVTTPEEYLAALARYDDELTVLDWAAPQDWMCEPVIIWSRSRSYLRDQALYIAAIVYDEEGRKECSSPSVRRDVMKPLRLAIVDAGPVGPG
ncbi:hypothetical protein ACIBHY_29530 [Nonomuraea sp. NPDC050547]|uniref:deazapurine DNA modification protein DpdA family protein n=1 Tax=Nonomuraea sp. NPDC050547 TaxID=3364368 RepID=UPI0037B8901F